MKIKWKQTCICFANIHTPAVDKIHWHRNLDEDKVLYITWICYDLFCFKVSVHNLVQSYRQQNMSIVQEKWTCYFNSLCADVWQFSLQLSKKVGDWHLIIPPASKNLWLISTLSKYIGLFHALFWVALKVVCRDESVRNVWPWLCLTSHVTYEVI